ncbi:MAG: hypothetical protein QM664_06655 [Flavihumibacter sp.]
MKRRQAEPRILLDADVIIHFIKAGYQMQLTAIFPGRLVMLDRVKKELTKRKSESLGIANFLAWCGIPVEPMPSDLAILKEYAALRLFRGDGESACMAVARFRKEYIASSNIKDIRSYCEEHQITYYTTTDMLAIAIEKKIMSETECDHFIAEVRQKGSKIPFTTMKEYWAKQKKMP